MGAARKSRTRTAGPVRIKGLIHVAAFPVTAVAAVVIAVVAGRCDRREAVNIELESW
jgi:hypothetical protein